VISEFAFESSGVVILLRQTVLGNKLESR